MMYRQTSNIAKLFRRTSAFWYSCAAVVLLLAPHLAAAALVPCSGLDCEFCSVGKLIQGLINFIITISIPIAAALFAYAGYLYASAGVLGKPGQISAAHGVFSRVAFGFILTLIGWLVINTILSTLLAGGPYTQGAWFNIPCVDASGQNLSRPGTGTGAYDATLNPNGMTGINTLLSDLVPGEVNNGRSGDNSSSVTVGSVAGSGSTRMTYYTPVPESWKTGTAEQQAAYKLEGGPNDYKGNPTVSVVDVINAAKAGQPLPAVSIALPAGLYDNNNIQYGATFNLPPDTAAAISAYALKQGVTIDPAKLMGAAVDKFNPAQYYSNYTTDPSTGTITVGKTDVNLCRLPDQCGQINNSLKLPDNQTITLQKK